MSALTYRQYPRSLQNNRFIVFGALIEDRTSGVSSHEEMSFEEGKLSALGNSRHPNKTPNECVISVSPSKIDLWLRKRTVLSDSPPVIHPNLIGQLVSLTSFRHTFKHVGETQHTSFKLDSLPTNRQVPLTDTGWIFPLLRGVSD